MGRYRHTALVAICLLWPGLIHAAEQLTAQALVEQQHVYVGAPFAFQIRVSGSESPEKPDLSGITGFRVEEMGGSQNSSQSVTIVNGRMNRVVERGYIFNYRLAATQEGTFTIPAIVVRAEGQTVRTQPIQIRAVPPVESDDFKLRISLSESQVYVGQPVTMKVTWYVGKNVRDFSFSVPALDDQRFDIIEPSVKPDPDRHVQISLSGGQTLAEKGRGELDGRDFLTVQFERILIPKQGGAITLRQATVAGQAIKGYQRRRSGFDSFFDDDVFGFGRQAVYENFVVPSNRPTLRVLDLPPAGRPDNFSGLVGDYKISAQATPTKVAVGDPITVTVRVSGPGYLGRVELPPLNEQPLLARDFKIPEEMASGQVEGAGKNFIQTIRARSSDVVKIPPIELSYFNPKSGTYEIARTEPIPLRVEGTRVVTARDAEGITETGSVQSEIESAEGGIAYNYEGPDVLVNQAAGPGAWLRSPGWLVGLSVPPLVYLGLLGFTLYGRWRDSDPAARRSRQALKSLSRSMSALKPADTDEYYAGVLDSLRRYLGDKLGVTAASLTFADVKPALERRGADGKTVEQLGQLFDRCEAGRYAGAAFGSADPSELAQSVEDIARKLEEAL
jgi:hypothetical protein